MIVKPTPIYLPQPQPLAPAATAPAQRVNLQMLAASYDSTGGDINAARQQLERMLGREAKYYDNIEDNVDVKAAKQQLIDYMAAHVRPPNREPEPLPSKVLAQLNWNHINKAFSTRILAK